MHTYIHAYIHTYIHIQTHTYTHTYSPIPLEKFTFEYWFETALERERDARERKQEVLSRGGTWSDFWSCEEGGYTCAVMITTLCRGVCVYVCHVAGRRVILGRVKKVFIHVLSWLLLYLEVYVCMYVTWRDV